MALPLSPKVVADSCGASHEQYIRAWMEYQKAMVPLRDLTLLGVTDVDTGPLSENPGLANLRFSLGPMPPDAGPLQDEWRDLDKRLSFPITVCTDATRTMDLLKGAGDGKGPYGLASYLTKYLEHLRQTALADAIALDVRKKASNPGKVATICGGKVQYQCADEHATNSFSKQSDCLAGVVDEDTIPVLGTFLGSGATHECFLMFDLIIVPLLIACPEIRVVLVDHGCQYGKHLQAHLLTLNLEPALLARLQNIITGVPMMHAEVHILSCRLLNSSLYIDLIGYIVGESSEQLWNQLKPFTKSTRNMMWANYIDFLNLSIGDVTKRKVAGLFKASWDEFGQCGDVNVGLP